MTSSIKTKNQIDGAPTPQNTPASVSKDSYLRNWNPLSQGQQGSRVPQTINEEDINAALARNPQLFDNIQGKLGTLLGRDSGYISLLPSKVKDRIFALKAIQQELFQLEKEFQTEMFELENKYLIKYTPFHKLRAALIKGSKEPTSEQIRKGKELDEEHNNQNTIQEEEKEEQDNVVGIPSFWLTAIENLPIISQIITDRDAEVLDYLCNVWMEYLTDGNPGFKLFFEFSDNSFFSHKVLTKAYYYQPQLGYSGDFIYDHAEGTNIKWNSNETNPTVTVEKRKQRNKTTKQVRTIEKITPVESFFNFFDPPNVPKCEENSETDEDNEEDGASELESKLALDYAIGEEIKDKLIPRAVDWFTGVAKEFDYDKEEGDDTNFYESEFDESENSDNKIAEESEDDDFSNVVKKENPPECKQS